MFNFNPLFRTSGLALLLLLSTSQSVTWRERNPRSSVFTESSNVLEMPSAFEVNHGQADREVKFLYRGNDQFLVLRSSGPVFMWKESDRDVEARMMFVGSNAETQLSGEELQPGTLSYLQGDDESRWIRNVSRYGRVRYSNLYPGIDLLFYTRNRELEFDFVLAPGADPNSIRFSFQDAVQSHIDDSGRLLIKTPAGQTRFHRPNVYQKTAHGRVVVSGAYRVVDPDHVTFEIGDYDHKRPLTIDPVWGEKTTWTGNPVKVAVDPDGGVYVTGDVPLTAYPNAKRLVAGNFITPGVLVAKMNTKLDTLEYAVILGGGGGNPDRGIDIAVDRDKYVYVTGHAGSTGFPTRNAIQSTCTLGPLRSCSDAFIARLDPAGDLVFSTYLGTGGNEEGRAIATDSNGNSYIGISGNDSSSDVFILKLNSAGQWVTSRTLNGSFMDFVNGIEVDDEGNMYIVGTTYSSNFPTFNALQPKTGGGTLTAVGGGGPFPVDAFVTKLDPLGFIVFSTYLGGSDDDLGLDVAVDPDHNIVITGMTTSTNFPTVEPVQAAFGGGRPRTTGSSGGGDVFVARIKADGSALTYSTYLGGAGDDMGNSVAVDALGNAYVTGKNGSADFPIKKPIPPFIGTGGFAAKLTTAGTLLWSSRLPAMSNGNAIALDRFNNAYVLGSGAGPMMIQKITAMEQSITLSGRSGMSVTMDPSDLSDPLETGYGKIQLDPDSAPLSAFAIFGLRQNGVLIGEAAVPATSLSAHGRIPVDGATVGGAVKTGIAIANPNGFAVVVSFFFTDTNGMNTGEGRTTILPFRQISAFLDEIPFRGQSSFQGTFTFTSSLPVAVIALRGIVNERSEFLVTTLPVTDLSSASFEPGEPVIFPHFAVGEGWSTQIDLVNPTDGPIDGVLRFYDSSGEPAPVTLGGQTSPTFSYSIAARSSKVMQTSGRPGGIRTGSVYAIPSTNHASPAGVLVFGYKKDGITVTEASVLASRPGSSFRLFAESFGKSGDPGSIQTGVAISNRSQNPVAVDWELTAISGVVPFWSGTATVPANGQLSRFLHEIPELHNLPASFRGVLRLSTSSPDAIAITGLRGRYNERGDFLICAVPALNESLVIAPSDSFLPHIAVGGGYMTQVVLLFNQQKHCIIGGNAFLP